MDEAHLTSTTKQAYSGDSPRISRAQYREQGQMTLGGEGRDCSENATVEVGDATRTKV